MNLNKLFESIKLKNIVGHISSEEINNITQDTRTVQPGDVFICITGEDFDGHSYAEQAIEKGAIAIVAEKPLEIDTAGVPVVYVNDSRKIMAILANHFYDYPSEKMSLIGVTGTNGKTTVTHVINELLKLAGKKTGLIGTNGMHIDDEFLPVTNTTPGNLTLQSNMKKMVDKGVTVCSLEVSSHSLVQGRTWGIDMDVAVLTNVTHEHLDYHKTMAGYRHAKELLFTQLGNNRKGENGKVAVINKDDEAFEAYNQATPAEVISYSTKDETADFFATNIKYDTDKTTFDLIVAGETYPVETQMIGEYNVSNTLAALGAVYALSLPLSEVTPLLKEVTLVEGRLELLNRTHDYQVYIDYAHSPDAIEKVLTTLKPITKGRLINIIGCQGSRDMEKRPVMGKMATEHADYVVFTTDSPELEDQASIIEMILAGVEKDNYTYIEDRKQAMYETIGNAQPGDTIVITGRGHEETYRAGGETIYFLDAAVAQEAIDYRNSQESN